MRTLCAVWAACLFVTAASAQPLTSGRPAGIQAARLSGWNQAVLIGTGAVIMAGVGFLVSGSSAALSSQKIDSTQLPFVPSNTIVVSSSTTT